MKKPIIGLTTYNSENRGKHPIAALAHKYIVAIMEAGGIPVLIPSILDQDQLSALLNELDGILFTGGGDISLDRFIGKPTNKLIEVDVKRDISEIFLVEKSVEEQIPFLGICRGMQVVNVALGGTLYTDIEEQYPNALKHDFDSYTERKVIAHSVRLKDNSELGVILGQTVLKVNSLHHQALKVTAPSLQPIAWASDGLVEAVNVRGQPFEFAVQWHPEWLTDQPASQKLFRSFIEACTQND